MRAANSGSSPGRLASLSERIRSIVLRRSASDYALRQIQIQHRLVARPQHRRLIHRRQEAVLVHRQAGLLRAVRIRHHHVGRQRFRLRAQPVHDPTSHRRKSRNHAARHHLILRRRVHHHVAVHRADHAQVVDNLRLVRKQVGNFNPRLAVLLERPLAPQNPRLGIDVLILHVAEFRRALLAVQLIEQRLRIPGLQMRRPARHVHEDERLGLRLVRHVRRLGRQRIVARRARLRFRHHRRKGQRAGPAEAVGQKLAAISGVTNVFGHISSRKETHSD